MYAPNSALLNALAHHKINFKQVLKFIDARYDFEPTAFQNGSQKNAAGENQGSCKIFCFAHLNNFNSLDTLALFAEHYQAVKDNPDGTDHQNIRQFIHHGWAGIHFEGHALTPKANMDEINAQAAQLYANGGSEFDEITNTATTSQQPVDTQPGAAPLINEPSDKLTENTENFARPSAPKDADGSVDQQSGSINPSNVDTVQVATVEHASQHTEKLDEARLEAKAEQAIHEAEAVKEQVIMPPSPGSSGSMATETTYYTDNDSVTEHTDHSGSAGPLPGDLTQHIADPQGVDTVMTNSTSSTDSSLHTQSTANHDTAKEGSKSAAELAQANDQHIADNPAAFIDDGLSTAPDISASSPAATQATIDTPNQSMQTSSGAGAASASEIVESNASHIASNPAEFIDEKNTETAADEPATSAEKPHQ